MTILYFILALLALGILVFIHELGHYIVAMKTGMKVEIFSIGFGKPLLKWKWKGVDWQLAMLPFGGFVKIAGMEFGKKDQNGSVDPYQVEGGFFKTSPWKRIAVALAGPTANFILAILLLTLLFAIGGRQKPFSEYTQIIGWVDPSSELYGLGVRPGDRLLAINGRPFTGSKDLLYSALQAGASVKLKGEHVDYSTQKTTPFEYSVFNYPNPNAIGDLYTTGIATGGSYLVYNKISDNASLIPPEASPMKNSGIQNGDRLVFADGELLFSQDQLSAVLNDGKSFLKVERQGAVFNTRQKRFLAGDLALTAQMKNEIMDAQYEGGLKGRWQQLYVLPYLMTSDGLVQRRLDFIEDESYKEAFPEHPFSESLEGPLQEGDRILAVDGVAVQSSLDVLKALQTRKVSLIVERDSTASSIGCWKDEDKVFTNSLDAGAIFSLAECIGARNGCPKSGRYIVLDPVEPKQMSQLQLSEQARKEREAVVAEQKKKIAEIHSPEKREHLLAQLEQNQSRYLLGVYFQDKQVRYNPNPIALFGNVFSETWWTLKSLVSGYLNPKFLAGPIGIVQVIQHGWRVGIGEALFWISAISVNLGFLNLLPIPVLDGGYICLSLWELITRRKVQPRTMERLIIPFVVLLFGLLIFLTFQDISRFF